MLNTTLFLSALEGLIAFSITSAALALLWWLSSSATKGREEGRAREGSPSTHATEAERHQEALERVEQLLQGAGLAILSQPSLLDKRASEPLTRSIDVVSVFGDALWALRVMALEGAAHGELSASSWSEKREGDKRGAEAQRELTSPMSDDLAFVEVLKTLARSKKLRAAEVRYGLVFVGGEQHLTGRREGVRLLSLQQLHKLIHPTPPKKTHAKRKAKKTHKSAQEEVSSTPPQDSAHKLKLEQSRELWRLIRARVSASQEDA